MGSTDTSGRRAALQNRALLRARELIDRMRSLYRALELLTGAPIGLHRALVCSGAEPDMALSRLAAQLGMRRPAASQILRATAGRAVFTLQRAVGQLPETQLAPFSESIEKLLTLLPAPSTSLAPAARKPRPRRTSPRK